MCVYAPGCFCHGIQHYKLSGCVAAGLSSNRHTPPHGKDALYNYT